MIIAIVIIAILGAAGYLYFLKHRASVLNEIAAIQADAVHLETSLRLRIAQIEDKIKPPTPPAA
jgi:hypothetical protein